MPLLSPRLPPRLPGHVDLHERRRGGPGLRLELGRQVRELLREPLVFLQEFGVLLFKQADALPGPVQLRPAGIDRMAQMLILAPKQLGFILEAKKLLKFPAIHGPHIIPNAAPRIHPGAPLDGKQLRRQVRELLREPLVFPQEFGVLLFKQADALPGPVQLRPAGIDRMAQMLILAPKQLGFILEAKKLLKFPAMARILYQTPRPEFIPVRRWTVNSYKFAGDVATPKSDCLPVIGLPITSPNPLA